MLIRTVRMTFHPERIADFLTLFDASADTIRAFPGCERLDLWEDQRFPNILSTFSLWENEAALKNYRRSEFFETTWAKTRPLFAAPPVAHSQRLAVFETDQ